MESNGLRKFLYRGYAAGLRGRVTKPYYQELGEHAVSTSYAGSAGSSSARNQYFDLVGDVAYDSVSTSVVGKQTGLIFRTVSTATIDNLRIRKRLTVKKVVSRLESVYLATDYPGRKVARISPAGSLIEDLRVDGERYEPKLPPAFSLDRDKKRLADFLAGKRDADDAFEPGDIPDPLPVRDFGTIHFAEWAWVHPDEKHRQHLTMLRLCLGSEFGAEMDVGMAESNGEGWPPEAQLLS